jgi:hypothetical protein
MQFTLSRKRFIHDAWAVNSARSLRMLAACRGYEQFVEALSNPDYEEHEDIKAWIGGAVRLMSFSTAEANKRLRTSVWLGIDRVSDNLGNISEEGKSVVGSLREWCPTRPLGLFGG